MSTVSDPLSVPTIEGQDDGFLPTGDISQATPEAPRDEETGSTRRSIRDLAAHCLPENRLLRSLLAAGIVTDLVLAGRGSPSLYQTGWLSILFGVIFVSWYWLTFVGLVATVPLIAGRITRPAFRHATYAAGLLLTGSIGLIWLVSWGSWWQTGRLADLETWRFILANYRQLWTYLRAAEPWQLASVIAAVLATTSGLLGVMVRIAQQRGMSPNQRQRLHQFATWSLGSLTVCVLWTHLPPSESSLAQGRRLEVLRYQFHPLMSLYVAQLEASLSRKIPRSIPPELLTPLPPDSTKSYLRGVGRSRAEPRAASVRSETGQLPSIIIVAVESLRHDTIHLRHQGREVLPNINRLANQGLQMRRAYAQSTHSDYADPCLLSSLYPLRNQQHHYYTPADPWPRRLLYDVLKPYGYATAIISSQNECWGGMSHFLQTPALDFFYHPETSSAETMEVSERDPGFSREVKLGSLVAGKFPDRHTTDQAIAWIRDQSKHGHPFLLSLNFQSSHFPYLLPADVPRPFQPADLGPNTGFVHYPKSETPRVWNAYLNAIHECDRQLGRLVQALERDGRLENTILVITGENGEAFHECGTVCHARAPVEPAIHVALVVHFPRRFSPAVSDYPVEHVDLAPTLLGLIGLAPEANFQGIDFLAANRPPADERLTFCHVQSSLAKADAVTLAGRWKLTHDRATGGFTLFDTQKDPLETTDLSSTRRQLAARLRQVLTQWRDHQLAYYRYPEYYRRFHPPRPPRWETD